MKRITVLLLAILMSLPTFADEKAKEVKSTIKHVTIFQQGAQVSREARASIPVGNSYLKFISITPNINPSSIQVKADGDFTVLSVTHQNNYIEKPLDSLAIAKIKTEQRRLQDLIDDENTILQVLAEEESLIISNKLVGTKEKGPNVDDLKSMAEFYRERIKEIRLEKLGINRKTRGFREQINALNQKLHKLNLRDGAKTSEIILAIHSKRATSGKFAISYIINQAGWTPSYDLRVKDIKSPVQLTYKANVYQQSGEEWKNVKLTLSTGSPYQSGVKPNLTTWFLNFYNPHVYRNKKDLQPEAQMPVAEEEVMDEVTIQGSRSKATDYYISNAVPVQEVEKATTISFEIELPYDIPTNGKKYVVQMKDHDLDAYYEYYCAPKKDLDAFLTAQVTGWEAYNLMNGEANLFFEGTYLGKSYLNVQSVDDTLNLSLGRDKNIVVKRTKQKEDKKKPFMSNKRIDYRAWDIEVRNKKRQKINIVIEDQIPIAVTDEIEVEKEIYDAEFEKDTGKLKWKFELDSAKTKKLSFKYTVKYSKKKRINLE